MNLTKKVLLHFIVAFAAGGLSPALGQDFPSLPSIFAHYSADNPANITAGTNQQFTSSAVDLANQKLVLPDIGFASIVYYKGIGPATPVYFSTTGVLPAPLQPSVPYYVVPATGGGYKVFPIATDADAPYEPGGLLGEKVLPAQNVSQGVLGIVFTNGGNGTHTIHTNKLLRQFTDMTSNGFHSLSTSSTDKHTMLEVVTDSAGLQFVRTAGATARENFVGAYNAYGQDFFQNGATGAKFAARQKVAEKRVVYQVFVCRVRSFKERQIMRILDGPERINTGTDQVYYGWDTRMSGKVATGDLVNVKATAGSSLPVPLAEGNNYYAHKVDANYMTLHPTAADAASNTNAVDLTTTGSGSCVFYFPQRVGDSKRWSFFTEMLAPNNGGNTLSARLLDPLPTAASILKIPSSFTVSGTNNGNVTGLTTVPDLTPVILWTPPGATLPAPLKPGTRYWTTRTPGSSTYGRLHATLASAKESVGKTTSASSCIKYGGTGSGEVLFNYDDDASYIGFGTFESAVEPIPTRVGFDQLCVLVFKIDFNDPDASAPLASIGVNEAVTDRIQLTGTMTGLSGGTKGLTPAAVNDGASAWSLFNSAQGHVPIDLDCYEIVFGSSTDAVLDSDLQTLVDYFRAKYHLPDPSPVSLKNWRYSEFGTYYGVGDAADLADPDMDGYPNLMEYATGTDPLGPGTSGINTLGKSSDGTRLAITFNRIADPALTYNVLGAPNLTGTWQSVWTSTGTSNIQGSVKVEDNVLMNAAPLRFLRLSVGY